MSTGQVMLTLASLILLGYIALNIQRMYVSAVETTVESQMTADAVNFGRDLSEEVQSYMYKYSQLDTDFGDMNDIYDPGERRSDTSQVGQIFHATVELSSEMLLNHGQNGRLATIRVYEELDDTLQFKAELVTSVVNMGS